MEQLIQPQMYSHFPYNVSTMSIFEQYYANVPLLFPSKRMTQQMIEAGFPLLSELSYRSVRNLPPMSLLGIDADPNNYNKENLMRSLEFADFHRFDNILFRL